MQSSRFRRSFAFLIALPLLTVFGLAACNTGGSTATAGPSFPVGTEQPKPGGGGSTFIVDAHKGGTASSFRIAEMFWGRLVDVHDIDALGTTNTTPVFEDFVINENVQSDGQKYVLETNPVTQEARLIIQRTKDDPSDPPGDTFFDHLISATLNMPPIQPKNEDPLGLPPFSFIARNAALVVRFDDLLDDTATGLGNLAQAVKVLTGYPVSTPFQPRLVFDSNYGGIGSGGFHSSRLIIDLTVSETEAADPTVTAPVNSLGLPQSLDATSSTAANVSLRIPTKVDFTSGQFVVLKNLSGSSMSTGGGPSDIDGFTNDVVRAMRSGNAGDANNGFLLDLNAPEVVGGWPITINSASDDPTGQAGFDFTVNMTFTTICKAAPQIGDIFELPNAFLEVTALSGSPDASGKVNGVPVRNLGNAAISAGSVVGGGTFLTPFEPGLFGPGELGCWVSFAPAPGTFPATDVQPSSQILLRFSEPIDPGGVLPFDSYSILRDDPALSLDEFSIVVGDVLASGDLKEYTFTPLLPLEHSVGSSEEYFIQLVSGAGSVTDLAGNALANDLPIVGFELDPQVAAEANGGIVMRFNGTDEIISGQAGGRTDIRGQFFYDLTNGLIFPRPVVRYSVVADRNQTIPGRMGIFLPGLQTPLSPLGSKVHNVYRYCDLGFAVTDESQYNIDVEGLWWSPVGGQIVADYFPEFETRFAHCLYLPDEAIDSGLLPLYPSSGLVTSLYANNILNDPLSPQKTVHPKPNGYTVSPFDLQVTAFGTFLMPFPLNRGSDPTQYVYYTWRDTSVLLKGGKNSAGIPLEIEVQAAVDPGPSGSIAAQNQVPSYGLPLLVEHRCYPSDNGIGLNALDIAIAINSSSRPFFRVFSTGGVNTTGTQVQKDPDLETKPTGGFNPGSSPAGKATPVSDNVFYFGQLDFVVRVSRVHTVWLDTLNTNPDYLEPVLEPRPDEQPSGTSLVIEYRGATGIPGTSVPPFDAAQMDAYGDVSTSITFLSGDSTWKSTIDEIDGARFTQARFTFLNDTNTNLEALLSAIGVAYVKN